MDEDCQLTDLITKDLNTVETSDGIHFNEGHTFEGTISCGVIESSGKLCWHDGIIYQGEFLKSEVTGKGKYIWPDGSSYEGEVVQGLRHGQGCFYCAISQTTYVGHWCLGRRHGRGQLTHDSSHSSYYDGEWVNDMKQGYGIEVYKCGDKYEGQWHENKRHGNGTMYWYSKSEVYKGEWSNDIQHGYGEHTWKIESHNHSQYPLANCYFGEWNNGIEGGYGSFHFSSGKVWTDKEYNNSEEVFDREEHLHYNTAVPKFNYLTLKELDFISSCDWMDIDVKSVKLVFLKYLSPLRQIYHFYSSLGQMDTTKSVLRRLQFSAFLKDIDIRKTGLTIFDAECIAGIRDKENFSSAHNPESLFFMKDFLLSLLLIAYNSDKSRMSFSLSLSNFLSVITSNCGNVSGLLFSGSLDNIHINLNYQTQLWDIYRRTKNMVGVVKYREALLLLKECKFFMDVFNSTEVMRIISEGSPEFDMEIKLSFLEFYEVMLRCVSEFCTLSETKKGMNWTINLQHFFEDKFFPTQGNYFE